MKRFILLAAFSFIIVSCSNLDRNKPSKELENKMNTIAEKYVKLVLNTGVFDPDYVDAYYGPDEWKPKDVVKDSTTLQRLYDESGSLLDSLDALSSYKANELETLRYKYLYKQLLAVKARLFMLAGGKFTFDEEAKALYDAEPPKYDAKYFDGILGELDKLIPGKGNLSERVNNFRNQFIIPKEKLDVVFQAAIKECRERTLQHIKLPAGENFKVEYVTDKPWAGYNWYKGNSYSFIQVNSGLPIYIDRAVDLGAHEGYPGHHVYNSLLEKEMVRQRGWMEFSVYPLFSPQSLIAEGSANYGIEVVLPGEERIKFEKEILFPLAGLDSSQADEYYKVLELTAKLTYAGNEGARHYLNGDWTPKQVNDWNIKYLFMTKERAEQRLKFIEKYRSYVINYNLGQDIIKNYLIKNGGTESNPAKRWELFEHILSTPQTPSNLK